MEGEHVLLSCKFTSQNTFAIFLQTKGEARAVCLSLPFFSPRLTLSLLVVSLREVRKHMHVCCETETNFHPYRHKIRTDKR